MRTIVIITFTVISLVSLIVFYQLYFSKNTSEKKAIVHLNSQPYSADPLDYDAFVHHVVFRSIYSSLVSQYKNGTIKGVLAESWNNSENFKTWRFKIRSNLTFENGDPITPSAILKSLTRAAFLMKKSGSNSGLFENIIDFDEINSPSSKLKGIFIEKDEIIFKLSKPIPNLLDVISFGIYGVVHESNFDSNTGNWLNKKNITSSGFYRISNWNDSVIEITLRNNFSIEDSHPNRFEKIHFHWSPEFRQQAHLVMGNSNESNLSDMGLTFFGGANSSIAYARCRSWKNKDSPCHSIENRTLLRNAFYSSLEKAGQKVTRSFFPLGIKSVHELNTKSVEDKFIEKIRVKYALTKNLNPTFQLFEPSIKESVNHLNGIAVPVDIPQEVFYDEYDQNLKSYMADIYMLGTGILIEAPLHDINFMFKAKEGIQLPDSSGLIFKELENNNPNIQLINEEIWKQAIIWPITHYASGFWAKSNVDLSLINNSLPPTDFNWVGWK
jgi:hypothetical protein